MSLRDINTAYDMRIVRGQTVEWTFTTPPMRGVVVGASGLYLRVLFNGAKKSVSLHPTWCVRYGDVVALPHRPRNRYAKDVIWNPH